MDLLPPALKVAFSGLYEGLPAFMTPSLSLASSMEAVLTRLEVPYRTKITRPVVAKQRKAARVPVYVVLLHARG